MNQKPLLLTVVAAVCQLAAAKFTVAELIAYESFGGMPLGSGLAGSGDTATGWSDSGWANGSNPRYQIVDPSPDLIYQITNGALLDGSNRALQLTTNPEPVPTGLLASRTIPAQNTTIYFGFLVRPLSIGTGSDMLYLRLSNGTTSIGVIELRPEVGQQYFELRASASGGGGAGGFLQSLKPSMTYLVVGRISWPNQGQVRIETWINPPAAYPGNGTYSASGSVSGSPVLSSIGFGISSADTGGPTSTAVFDEIRIGYTWADVVLPGPPTANLGNISTRLRVETGDNVLIGGFIVTGTEPKKVIVRAIGPSLNSTEFLQNPTLELFGPAGLIASNDNWGNAPNKQEIIDSTIPPSREQESAILATLPANNNGYTAVMRGAGGSTGIGVVEIYDLNRTADSTLANISSRGFVQTGDNVMIGGFIVSGDQSQDVIVRAIGPSLNISGRLADPTLELYDGNGVVITMNDNWKVNDHTGQSQEAEIAATTVPPTNDLESAIIATLPAGNYTAVVRGKNAGTGVALVEVYALN